MTEKEEDEATAKLEKLGRFPIPGSMKVPSIIPLDGALYTRETSCFSPCCWSDMTFDHRCEGWMPHTEKVDGRQRAKAPRALRTDALPSDTLLGQEKEILTQFPNMTVDRLADMSGGDITQCIIYIYIHLATRKQCYLM